MKEIRKKMIQGDLSICSDLCCKKNAVNNDNPCNYSPIAETYPTEFAISTDTSCNVRCKICRDEPRKTEYDKINLDSVIKNLYIPIFKNAKLVRFGVDGESFSSYKECQLIKALANTYPEIKFHILTNGILGNEQFLKRLNIYDRIDTFSVSVHSATRWTYNKIVKGGNWNKLLENLSLYSNMKNQKIINDFMLIFVVFSENYKEMPKFVQLAEKYSARPIFWTLRKNTYTKIGQNFSKYSIISPENKHYKDLKEILKNPIFDQENVTLQSDLKALREKALSDL